MDLACSAVVSSIWYSYICRRLFVWCWL